MTARTGRRDGRCWITWLISAPPTRHTGKTMPKPHEEEGRKEEDEGRKEEEEDQEEEETAAHTIGKGLQEAVECEAEAE